MWFGINAGANDRFLAADSQEITGWALTCGDTIPVIELQAPQAKSGFSTAVDVMIPAQWHDMSVRKDPAVLG